MAASPHPTPDNQLLITLQLRVSEIKVFPIEGVGTLADGHIVFLLCVIAYLSNAFIQREGSATKQNCLQDL